MKIHKTETVVRYQVTFTPPEMKKLMAHDRWRHVVGLRREQGTGRWGDASLTKRQFNDICDVLGYNGREMMATLLRDLRGDG